MRGKHAMVGRHRPLGSAAQEAVAMWRRFTWLLTGLMVGTMAAPLMDTAWCVARLVLAGSGLTCLTLMVNAEARVDAEGGDPW